MLKTFYKKLIVVTLVTVMLLSVLPMAAFADGPFSVVSGAITVSSTKSSTMVNDVFTATATSTSGCNSVTTETNEITIKNVSGSEGTVSFRYTLTLNGGTAKINGTAVTSSSTYSASLANNASITVSITSSSSAANTTTIALSNFNIVLTGNTQRTVTVNGAVGGTVRYSGGTLSNGQSTSISTDFNTGLTLTAVPAVADGYDFGYWKDGNGKILSTSEVLILKPLADTTVIPVFTQGGVFSVGSNIFLSLSEAISYAQGASTKVIVPYKNCTVSSGNYTIPNGVTLLVPFDSANTVYTTTDSSLFDYNVYSNPVAYRTLTLGEGANITVANGGKISVPSRLTTKGQFGGTNGMPYGFHGRIDMNEGSSITLQSGAELYAYGFISGSGHITAQSGSTVYECFQIKNWRGGSISTSSKILNGTVFLFNQYFIQNIEVPLTLNYGATEKIVTAVNMSSSVYSTSGTFIGTGGLFIPNSSGSSITKSYDGATDRMTYDVVGNCSLNSMTLKLAGQTVKSSSYVLPIANNFTINVHSGTTTINSDLAFITGSRAVIDKSAQVTIANGAEVYIYDADEWGFFAGNEAMMYPVSYTTVNGTRAIRNNDSLTDVVFDVNGTLNISGAFYTTTGGADITSSKKTGRINFSAAAGTATKTQQIANQEDVVDVAITAAQLHNGNGSYTATSGSKSGDYFAYSPLFNQWKKNYDVSSEAYLDINEDGSFDMGDISLIVNYSNNNDTMTSSQQSKADLNGDGVIDEFDAAYLDRIFYPDPNGYVDGDVDQDGDVDLTDYTLIRDYMSGVAQGTSTADLMAASYLDQDRYAELIDVYGDDIIVTQQYYTADINYDKAVDAFDLFIVDKINNNIV